MELTDHHGVVIATRTRAVAAKGRVVVSITPPRHAEGVRVRIGEFMMDDSAHGPNSAVEIGSGGVAVEGDDWAETIKK